jgi:hypothetical protein
LTISSFFFIFLYKEIKFDGFQRILMDFDSLQISKRKKNCFRSSLYNYWRNIMKRSKFKNIFVFISAPIFLLLFLTSCSEQQLILSPDIETPPTITTSDNIYPFSDAELYPLDGEVIREGNVTTVKPKNKISHKEFLESLPYEVTEVTDDKQKEEIFSSYKSSSSTLQPAASYVCV